MDTLAPQDRASLRRAIDNAVAQKARETEARHIRKLEIRLIKAELEYGNSAFAKKCRVTWFVLCTVAQNTRMPLEQMQGGNRQPEATAARQWCILLLCRLKPLGYFDSDLVKMFGLKSSSQVAHDRFAAMKRLQLSTQLHQWVPALHLDASTMLGVRVTGNPLVHPVKVSGRNRTGRPTMTDTKRWLAEVGVSLADFYAQHRVSDLTPGQERQLSELLVERMALRADIALRELKP